MVVREIAEGNCKLAIGIAWLATSFVTQTVCAQQQFIRLSAEVELFSYQSKDSKRNLNVNRTYRLTCIVGTNGWRIESDFLTNAKEAVYFDGTNVHRSVVRTKETPVDPKMATRNGRPVSVPFDSAQNLLTLYVSPSEGPPLGNLGANIPWLAFCSGSYLRRESRVIPLPTTEVLTSPDAFAYEDKTTVFQDGLGLPRTVELITSKERFRTAVRDAKLIRTARIQGARINHPNSKLSDGLVKFKYEVDEVTNFNGWTFPAKFHYVDYGLTGGEPEKCVGGVGRLTSIELSPKPENVFIPNMQTSVVDYRLRSQSKMVDGIIYSSTNLVNLPSTNDPALRKIFADMERSAPPDVAVPLNRSWRNCVRGALLLCVVMPVVVGWLFRNQKCKREQK